VGVWYVDNYLKVRPKERPTDAEMEKQLKLTLRLDPLLTNCSIDAAVINRTAYLSGEVDSSSGRAEAQDVASRIKGMVSVRNRVKVVPEYSVGSAGPPDNYWPHPASTDFGPQPYESDEEIKKTIERAFSRSPFVDPSSIMVAVHGGVATLTGEVGSWIGWGEADTDARRSGAAYLINEIKITRETGASPLERARDRISTDRKKTQPQAKL